MIYYLYTNHCCIKLHFWFHVRLILNLYFLANMTVESHMCNTKTDGENAVRLLQWFILSWRQHLFYQWLRRCNAPLQRHGSKIIQPTPTKIRWHSTWIFVERIILSLNQPWRPEIIIIKVLSCEKHGNIGTYWNCSRLWCLDSICREKSILLFCESTYSLNTWK